MAPKKTEKVSAESMPKSGPISTHKAAESSQSSSIHMQDAVQPPNIGSQQNLAGSTDVVEGT